MAETIEQMVERLADEHLKYFIYGHESCGVLEFARACMLEQAKRDAAICHRQAALQLAICSDDGVVNQAYRCAADIIKEAEGMK